MVTLDHFLLGGDDLMVAVTRLCTLVFVNIS